MPKRLFLVFLVLFAAFWCPGWGFLGHKKINRLAVFTLPPEMIGFYKKHIAYLSEAAVNPDRRRYSVVQEAPRHYIDLDDYGDSAVHKLPRYWTQAVEKWGEDSLLAKGILPWHIYRVYGQLRDAFLTKDPARILRLSAELGHYVSDAQVPLHTTKNYNGQLTNQEGIHGFWESRLPELYLDKYDFLVGRAEYLTNVQLAAWQAVARSHALVDSVLTLERTLSSRMGDRKYNFETKGKQTVKVYSESYAREYHRLLGGMVERQLRASIKMTGSIWYTAWVDAGQPDVKALMDYRPSEEEIKKRQDELRAWRARTLHARVHETED
ncbi:MAG: zinc dependent phospholipase C family protein [Cyclobacteriaceae bacterium]|jgi:hypothetical protein|nr:zinc dependent phospholipase C family protein [Cyclobacteriaceae bacterium]